MITVHASECERYHLLFSDAGPLQSEKHAPESVGIRSVSSEGGKPLIKEDVPDWARLEEIKSKWIVADIGTIYKEIIDQYQERLFGLEEKLVHEVFYQKMLKECSEYLKSYQLRKLVFGRLVDRMFTQRVQEEGLHVQHE